VQRSDISARAVQIVTGHDRVLQKCRAIGLTCAAVSSKREISVPNRGREEKKVPRQTQEQTTLNLKLVYFTCLRFVAGETFW